MAKRITIKHWYRKCCKLAESLFGIENIIIEVNYQHSERSESVYMSIYDIDKHYSILTPGTYIGDYLDEEENIKRFSKYESIVANILNKK